MRARKDLDVWRAERAREAATTLAHSISQVLPVRSVEFEFLESGSPERKWLVRTRFEDGRQSLRYFPSPNAALARTPQHYLPFTKLRGEYTRS